MPPSNLPSWLRTLIYDVAAKEWPGYYGLYLEAQVLVESGGQVDARSEAGAVGLMQLMPSTAAGLGFSVEDLLLPRKNLTAGLRHLKEQWDKFPEVYRSHRLSFALASYNCGRGWVNQALKLARADCGAASSRDPGNWQRWEVAGPYLEHPKCRKAGGQNPDGRAAMLYVARFWAVFDRLNRGSK
ncbi:MAG: transglycosylase SLT domain-containing protein [Proteobacteria bacterium]|nr:transglycosylase SLT domain-containing protein [Pseudomonadota bacterium]MBU4381582.1 transglycosylase SLT domain-containing protein [Pseudomonadota bacterium]MCG2766568.1 transglycosylase SLT domain-containing protein [Desulfarculaceae bacterium]